MKPVLHIGPSKTASTSIQEIIPHLGRPYVIKPAWARHLARAPNVTVQKAEIPSGLIFSEEIVGDFSHQPPTVVAGRLFDMFGRSIVVWVDRDPAALLRSYYHQAIKNNGFAGSLEDFDEIQRRVFALKGIGHYAKINVANVRSAFERYHDFRVVPFSLLEESPRQFMTAFCSACEAQVPEVDMPHLNRTV